MAGYLPMCLAVFVGGAVRTGQLSPYMDIHRYFHHPPGFDDKIQVRNGFLGRFCRFSSWCQPLQKKHENLREEAMTWGKKSGKNNLFKAYLKKKTLLDLHPIKNTQKNHDWKP